MTKVVVTIGALAVVAVRLVWPSLGIDLVAVALLVLAAVPWLDGIFKSLQTPFGGVEYREIESRLDELAGATASTRQLAEANEARDLARQDAPSPTVSPNLNLLDLANEYDATRKAMQPGVARTDEMTGIVGRMIVAVERGADLDLPEALKDQSGGRRLAAYVMLYVRPDGAYLLPVVDAVLNEEKAFGQYWALRSLARIVDVAPASMDMNTLRRLGRLYDELPVRSDRRYELGRILGHT
jgi:hypothetical protein